MTLSMMMMAVMMATFIMFVVGLCWESSCYLIINLPPTGVDNFASCKGYHHQGKSHHITSFTIHNMPDPTYPTLEDSQFLDTEAYISELKDAAIARVSRIVTCDFLLLLSSSSWSSCASSSSFFPLLHRNQPSFVRSIAQRFVTYWLLPTKAA